jgi:hypothetical protein
VKRKTALPADTAERQLIDRELTGLRYSYKDAGGIIEDLAPTGALLRVLSRHCPRQSRGKVLPLRRADPPDQ